MKKICSYNIVIPNDLEYYTKCKLVGKTWFDKKQYESLLVDDSFFSENIPRENETIEHRQSCSKEFASRNRNGKTNTIYRITRKEGRNAHVEIFN